MGYQTIGAREEPTVVEQVAREFEHLEDLIQPYFRRREPYQTACDYLQALLSTASRKNSWGLSEEAGRADPYGFQHFLLRAKWDADALRNVALDYARRGLGEGGVLAVDESSFLKKGDKSVGVARQYSGTAGKTENCQVGVFLAYATEHGHALVDRELYLPEDWANDSKRREEADVPKEVEFQTKGRLAQAMVARAFAAGLRPSWVTGDEVYGRDGKLRRSLEQRHQKYVFAIASNTHVWWGFSQVMPSQVLGTLSERDWIRISAGAGSKGPRLYDWARVPINRHDGTLSRWLMFRRSINDPRDVAYYLVHAPERTALETMVEAAGKRWAIEECFESAKGEVGLKDYEVRTWTAWYRHMTLCLLAHVFLAVARAQINAPQDQPLPKTWAPPHPRSRMSRFMKRRGHSSDSVSKR